MISYSGTRYTRNYYIIINNLLDFSREFFLLSTCFFMMKYFTYINRYVILYTTNNAILIAVKFLLVIARHEVVYVSMTVSTKYNLSHFLKRRRKDFTCT